MSDVDSSMRSSIAAMIEQGPQPIRRGDVVQFARGYTPPPWRSGYEDGNFAFEAGELEVVKGVQLDAFTIFETDEPIPCDVVVRIGRARYYPDGSPVGLT